MGSALPLQNLNSSELGEPSDPRSLDQRVVGLNNRAGGGLWESDLGTHAKCHPASRSRLSVSGAAQFSKEAENADIDELSLPTFKTPCRPNETLLPVCSTSVRIIHSASDAAIAKECAQSSHQLGTELHLPQARVLKS